MCALASLPMTDARRSVTSNSHPRAEPETALVDAVVVAYRSGATLRGCVESLAAAGARVTVVDNACPEDSAATVAGLDGVEVVRSARNGGFGYGCNLGA